MEKYFILGFLGSILALGFSVIQRRRVLSVSEGNERMQKIAAAIRAGANAYLKHQYTTVFKVFAIVFVLLLALAFGSYLAMRLLGNDMQTSLLYATACVSLKMETPGVFRGSREDVEDYIRQFYQR